MSTLVVRGGRALRGFVRPPPDKSVGHRALFWAAVADGDSRVVPWAPGADVRATARVLQELSVRSVPDGGGLRVLGVGGPGGLRATDRALDCENSGTTLRLGCGWLAAVPGRHTLTGDPSLRRRPMERLRVLEAMGARFEGASPLRAPVVVHGTARPHATRAALPVASAQVKGALLSAGLWADDVTRVEEPGESRDHTERGLSELGVSVRAGPGWVEVEPVERPWAGRTFSVPPDFSSAAFLLGASFLTGGAVQVEAGANPTRTGFAEALEALGARVRIEPAAPCGPEPVAVWSVSPGSGLRGGQVSGATALRALDELPLWAGLAAFVSGESRIADAEELQVKESDRIAAMHRVLGAFSVASTPEPDGLIIRGGSPVPADVDAGGDHRVAMTAAVMGLGIAGTTRVRGADVIGVSYPGFVDALRSLGADVAWED